MTDGPSVTVGGMLVGVVVEVDVLVEVEVDVVVELAVDVFVDVLAA